MMITKILPKFSILFYALLFLYTSCSFVPKYKRPAPMIPKQWPKGSVYKDIPKKGPLPFMVGWRKFFKDKKLKAIIELALKNNLDLRLAVINMEQARAMYGLSKAKIYPSLDLTSSYTKQRVPSDLSFTHKSYINKQVDVLGGITSWEIDLFGRLRSLKQKDWEEFLAQKENRRAVQISLIRQIASLYIKLAADRESLKTAKKMLKTYEETYRLVKEMYKNGLAPQQVLYRAKAQVEGTKVLISRYTQMIELDKNALNLLVGTNVPNDLLPKDLNSIPPPAQISAGISSLVLLNRPDVMAAEHKLKASYAYVGVARSAFFPNIVLTATGGTASDELSGLFAAGSGTWLFSTKALMPVFDPRVWAAYRLSKVQRKLVLVQYQKTIQKAFREVADTLASISTTNKQLAAQKSLVKSLKKSYILAQNRYAEGLDSYLDVLDAQRSLLQAQLDLISIKRAKYENQIRLYAVLGGGAK